MRTVGRLLRLSTESRLTRLLPALAALALVLYPTRASAGAPTPLEAGEPAPFAGLIVEHGHAAALFRAEAQASRLRGELRGTRAQLLRTEADLVAERQARQVDRDEAAERERASEAARVRAEALARELVEPPAWYARPSFIIPTTAVVTIGVVLGFVYALR